MAYDQYRQTHTQEDIFRGSDIDQIFQDFAQSYGFRNADEIFREFYGPGFKGYVYQRPGFTYTSYVYNPGQTAQEQPAQEQPSPPESPLAQMGVSGRMLKFLLEKVLRIQIPERGKVRLIPLR